MFNIEVKSNAHLKKFFLILGFTISFNCIAQNQNNKINPISSPLHYFKEKMIDLMIAENKNSPFTYLTPKYLFSNQDYKNMFFKNKSVNLKTTQNLALYISDIYKIELPNAELIVLNSYKESFSQNLEPLLFLSLIGIESSYQSNSVSFLGAKGLSQVLPIYHQNKINNLTRYNLDILSIAGNIKVGTQILREYLDLSNGNIVAALQRYNGTLNDKNHTYSKKVLDKRNTLEQVAGL
jgi:hypothetical protein